MAGVSALFLSAVAFVVGLVISLFKIKIIMRGVAGRVLALYRPSVSGDES